jgi:DNA-binding SARP family transcriptional activator
VKRVSELVGSAVDLPSRAAGVAALLLVFGGVGRTAQYGDLDRHVWAVLSRQDLGPAARIHIIWMQAYQMHLAGDDAGARVLLEQGRTTARHHSFALEDLRLRLSQLQSNDFADNLDDLGTALVEIEPVFLQAPQMLKAHFRYLQGMYHLACGELDAARDFVEESEAIIANSSWPLAQCLIRLCVAEVYCELGRYEDALRYVSMCQEAIKDVDAPVLRFNSGLLRAQISLRTHHQQKFAAELRAALSIGRRHGLANGFCAYSSLLARLVPYALELEIEVPYCRSIILKRSIKPPSADIPHWPWPLRIKAMGTLEIFVDEVALEFHGKSKGKPVDLLKVLLAHSAGIETTHVMDLLWPDLEGDGARNAFDLALHRLRKLLKAKDTVLLVQGHLLINTRLIWVDAFVLGRMSAEGLSGDLTRLVSRFLALYRAPFLADDETPSIFAARERLRSQFIRFIAAVSSQLERDAQWDPLVALLRQAAEIEPLEEELYRHLIRTLMVQGRVAEAEAVFARCEQYFWRLLHRRPSPSTRSLICTP